MARSRWPIEQQDRELKDDPGLDHYEGRTCAGCTHHTVPTSRFLASAASQLAATAGPS